VGVTGLSGLEKFSHLEDKIYRTIEHCKTLKTEKERLEAEASQMRREVISLSEEKERLEQQLERLYSERDTIKLKVEAMLDAIAVLENEVESVGK
jgi:chromosome segregation ATPase